MFTHNFKYYNNKSPLCMLIQQASMHSILSVETNCSLFYSLSCLGAYSEASTKLPQIVNKQLKFMDYANFILFFAGFVQCSTTKHIVNSGPSIVRSILHYHRHLDAISTPACRSHQYCSFIDYNIAEAEEKARALKVKQEMYRNFKLFYAHIKHLYISLVPCTGARSPHVYFSAIEALFSLNPGMASGSGARRLSGGRCPSDGEQSSAYLSLLVHCLLLGCGPRGGAGGGAAPLLEGLAAVARPGDGAGLVKFLLNLLVLATAAGPVAPGPAALLHGLYTARLLAPGPYTAAYAALSRRGTAPGSLAWAPVYHSPSGPGPAANCRALRGYRQGALGCLRACLRGALAPHPPQALLATAAHSLRRRLFSHLAELHASLAACMAQRKLNRGLAVAPHQEVPAGATAYSSAIRFRAYSAEEIGGYVGKVKAQSIIKLKSRMPLPVSRQQMLSLLFFTKFINSRQIKGTLLRLVGLFQFLTPHCISTSNSHLLYKMDLCMTHVFINHLRRIDSSTTNIYAYNSYLHLYNNIFSSHDRILHIIGINHSILDDSTDTLIVADAWVSANYLIYNSKYKTRYGIYLNLLLLSCHSAVNGVLPNTTNRNLSNNLPTLIRLITIAEDNLNMSSVKLNIKRLVIRYKHIASMFNHINDSHHSTLFKYIVLFYFKLFNKVESSINCTADYNRFILKDCKLKFTNLWVKRHKFYRSKDLTIRHFLFIIRVGRYLTTKPPVKMSILELMFPLISSITSPFLSYLTSLVILHLHTVYHLKSRSMREVLQLLMASFVFGTIRHSVKKVARSKSNLEQFSTLLLLAYTQDRFYTTYHTLSANIAYNKGTLDSLHRSISTLYTLMLNATLKGSKLTLKQQLILYIFVCKEGRHLDIFLTYYPTFLIDLHSVLPFKFIECFVLRYFVTSSYNTLKSHTINESLNSVHRTVPLSLRFVSLFLSVCPVHRISKCIILHLYSLLCNELNRPVPPHSPSIAFSPVKSSYRPHLRNCTPSRSAYKAWTAYSCIYSDKVARLKGYMWKCRVTRYKSAHWILRQRTSHSEWHGILCTHLMQFIAQVLGHFEFLRLVESKFAPTEGQKITLEQVYFLVATLGNVLVGPSCIPLINRLNKLMRGYRVIVALATPHPLDSLHIHPDYKAYVSSHTETEPFAVFIRLVEHYTALKRCKFNPKHHIKSIDYTILTGNSFSTIDFNRLIHLYYKQRTHQNLSTHLLFNCISHRKYHLLH